MRPIVPQNTVDDMHETNLENFQTNPLLSNYRRGHDYFDKGLSAFPENETQTQETNPKSNVDSLVKFSITFGTTTHQATVPAVVAAPTQQYQSHQ